MTLLAYIAMLVVGLVLGLIGGGGAILTMPVLVYLLAVPPAMATSYSLFVVGCTSLFGVWRYHFQGSVDYRSAVIFVLPSFLGTYLARRLLLPSIPPVVFILSGIELSKDKLIMIAFAIVMLAASVSMIRARPPSPSQSQKSGARVVKLLALGLAVGFVAGFVGAGGGFLIIPALVFFGGLSMNAAIPTSLLIISANSLVGFAGDVISNVSIDWALLSRVTASSAVGLLGGVRLSRSVSPGILKSGFGWFVLAMGAWILLRQL